MAVPLMTEVFLFREDLKSSWTRFDGATSDTGHPPKTKGLEASRDVSNPPAGKGLEPEKNVDYLAQSDMSIYTPSRWDKSDADPPGLMIVGGAP